MRFPKAFGILTEKKGLARDDDQSNLNKTALVPKAGTSNSSSRRDSRQTSITGTMEFNLYQPQPISRIQLYYARTSSFPTTRTHETSYAFIMYGGYSSWLNFEQQQGDKTFIDELNALRVGELSSKHHHR